jgi:hypothetical protein
MNYWMLGSVSPVLVAYCLVRWFYACCLVACFVDFGLLFLLRLFSWFLFSWLLVVELLHNNRRDNNNKTTLTIYKIIIMIACINSTARTACANWNGERYSSGSLILAFSNTTNDGSRLKAQAAPCQDRRSAYSVQNGVILLFCWFLAVVDCLVECPCCSGYLCLYSVLFVCMPYWLVLSSCWVLVVLNFTAAVVEKASEKGSRDIS